MAQISMMIQSHFFDHSKKLRIQISHKLMVIHQPWPSWILRTCFIVALSMLSSCMPPVTMARMPLTAARKSTQRAPGKRLLER